ncbi:hypothetical protein ONS95_008095 [Cadophora gregata]|uniref:uncharacterized protein n=1 Tax=Cadophora gregata TaxID=51156 RepID=UPI0026DCDD0C|nr:uncharacterized protein ONS95_008095 [Cadophora gregata]KAK0126498.1 hypothetical protein ONS95_008095 [Cadophora gregata]
MASPMGPPQPAGYSLRVQLFGPTAYDVSDKPIRCFRVVASPENTVEEFCVEASRIHQINYGTPLALKKVQDDQQFDITQSEILGSLFATASTIRFVQASSIPGREDSVAPNSALRFDPSVSRKREREGSARVNGSTSANTWKSNKRQRVADPDEPLPSRESEVGARETSRTNGLISETNIIPNSQESIVLGNPNGPFHNSRHHNLDEDFNIQSQRHQSSPLGEASARAQSQGSNPRAKSASYHIQRATERGTSVSTAATSPLSVDQRLMQNGAAPVSQRRRPESRSAERERNGRPSMAQDETSIYENIASDDEEFGLASIAKGRKASLKARNSTSGLPGLEWSKNKFNTPPTGSRRSSGSKEQPTPGELPLTPNSKEREARQKQKQEAEEARKTRLAAAEARQAEETLKAEAKRAELEEQERIQVEDFKHGEAERKAAIARSARLEKEREEREKREADEERLREEGRIAKEKAEEERRVKEDRLAREKAAADEADRLRKEEEQAAVAALKGKKTLNPDESRHTKSSSPILPKPRGGTPSSSSKVQSSTPFIPGQRKSALKRTASSQAMRSSSPTGSKASTDDSSTGVGIENQMPFPKVHGRRVSFRDEPEDNVTPIRPPSRILPPKFGTPNSKLNGSTPKPSPNIPTPNSSTPKPPGLATRDVIAPSSTPRSSQGTILPPPRSNTPILPPGRSIGRSSLGRSITPVGPKAAPATKESTPDVAKRISSAEKDPSPEVTRRTSSIPAPPRRKSITPVPAAKEKSKSAEPEPKQPTEVEISSDDSEEDIPSRPTPKKQPLGLRSPEKPKTAETLATEEGLSDDEDVETDRAVDEDETQSHNSSLRDSRSPVIFSQHPKSTDTIKARNSQPLESDSDSASEANGDDDEDQDEEDSEVEDEPRSTPRNKFVDDEAEDGESISGSEDDEDAEEVDEDADDDEAEVDVPNSSPPVLPAHKPQVSPKPAGINSTHSTIPPSSALVYPPTSSAAPRPAMKVGVSLSSLSKSKSMLATSSSIKPVVGRSGQRTLQTMYDEESEESEEESDEDSSDVSEFEAPKPSQKAKSATRRDSSSDSDSSGNSDSDSEGEKARKKIRDELALQIAGVKGDENLNLLSPRLYKTSTQQQETSKERKKKAEKKTDKYVSGYRFNTGS